MKNNFLKKALSVIMTAAFVVSAIPVTATVSQAADETIVLSTALANYDFDDFSASGDTALTDGDRTITLEAVGSGTKPSLVNDEKRGQVLKLNGSTYSNRAFAKLPSNPFARQDVSNGLTLNFWTSTNQPVSGTSYGNSCLIDFEVAPATTGRAGTYAFNQQMVYWNTTDQNTKFTDFSIGNLGLTNGSGWKMVTMVVTTTGISFYCNGQKISHTITSGAEVYEQMIQDLAGSSGLCDPADTNVRIGASLAPYWNCANALIDDISFYGKALNDNEVATLYDETMMGNSGETNTDGQDPSEETNTDAQDPSEEASTNGQKITFDKKYNVMDCGMFEKNYGREKITTKIVVPQNGRVNIIVGNYESANETYTHIILRKDNAYEPWVDMFPDIATEKVESSYITLIPGEYEINIYEVGANNDTYLKVEYQKEGDYVGEVENNDSFDMANEISVNKAYRCDYSKEGDEDYFKFELDKPGKLKVRIDTKNFISTTELYYEEKNGNVKLVNSSQWDDSSKVMRHNIERLPAGTYFLKIRPFRDRDTNECSFFVDYQSEEEGYEKEWNNYSSNANECFKDIWYIGNLSNDKDKDLFEFNLEKSMSLNLEFKVPRQIENGLFSVKIYDSDLKTVYYEVENTANPYICSEEIPLKAGKYYVYVSTGNGRNSYSSTSEYMLSTYDYSFSIHAVETLPFKDVMKNVWYYDSVCYVYWNEIMTGMNQTMFEPNSPLARAQFATIVYRMENSPQVSYNAKFPDVSNGIWYTNPILWASNTGIVTGYEHNGCFGPADKINREQMAVMMYRYAKYKGYNVNKKTNLNRFADASAVNDFAQEAMEWAVGMEIITGKDSGTKLDPQGNASRAECAAIIMRFNKLYK